LAANLIQQTIGQTRKKWVDLPPASHVEYAVSLNPWHDAVDFAGDAPCDRAVATVYLNHVGWAGFSLESSGTSSIITSFDTCRMNTGNTNN